MPRPKKTEAQLNEMRQRILDAAYAVLLEHGPYGLTSRTIAERVGVTHMALFTYFPNQAAILQALSERETAKMRAPQAEIEQRAAHEDIEPVMAAALSFFVSYAQNNPKAYHLAWVMPELRLETPEQNRRRMQNNVGFLARLIKTGIERGNYTAREPVLAAATVLGMINMPYILFHSGKMVDPDLRDRMAGEALGAALNYLKSPVYAAAPGPAS